MRLARRARFCAAVQLREQVLAGEVHDRVGLRDGLAQLGLPPAEVADPRLAGGGERAADDRDLVPRRLEPPPQVAATSPARR
jgi:hypothetical protein